MERIIPDIIIQPPVLRIIADTRSRAPNYYSPRFKRLRWGLDLLDRGGITANAGKSSLCEGCVVSVSECLSWGAEATGTDPLDPVESLQEPRRRSIIFNLSLLLSSLPCPRLDEFFGGDFLECDSIDILGRVGIAVMVGASFLSDR